MQVSLSSRRRAVLSTYYLLLNYDKKEWIDSGNLGLGCKEWAYEYHVTTLLGYLMYNRYDYDFKNRDVQYNPKTDITEAKSNFDFAGHWVGDRVMLVSEHDQDYETVRGYGPRAHEARDWVNISKPLALERNHNIKDWYKDSPEMQDWVKQHLYEDFK